MAYEPHLTPDSPDSGELGAPRIARPVIEPDGLDVDVASESPPSPVNYRFLVISAIGVIAVVGAVTGLHAYQLQQIANEFRERGTQARESGDFEAAVEHLQRYVAIAPDDIEAIEHLAFSLSDAAETSAAQYRATKLFEQILRDSPDSVAVRRKLADLYRELGNVETTLYSDAVDHYDRLLIGDPANAELLALRAECQEAIGKYSAAREDYAKAIELSPRNLELYGKLVRLLSSRLDQPKAALDMLNELVQRNPKSAEGYLARSQFHWEQGRILESRIDAVRAYRLDPDSREVLTFLVTLSSFSDWPSQPVTMDELRAKLREVEPTPGGTSADDLALVDLAILTGEYADAERKLEAILEKRPDWTTALQVYADVLILMGKQREADEVIAQIENLSTGGSNLSRFLRAENAYSRREWPLAAGLYRRIFQSSSPGPFVRTLAGLKLASCYQEMGQSVREQRTCLDVLAVNPNSTDAVAHLAQSYLRSGNLDEALEQFQRLPDGPEAALAIAYILLDKNRRLPDALQRWNQVEAALTTAVQAQASPSDVVLLRSQMISARGREQEAVDILQRALQENTGDARIWLQLFEVVLSQQNVKAAAEVLERADEVLQRPDVTRSAWIRLATVQEDGEMLSEIANSIDSPSVSEENSASKENRERLAVAHQDLAVAWQSLGDVEQARSHWCAVKQLQPYDINVLQSLIALALFEADDERARELVQEIKDVEGSSGVQWRMAEVARLLALVERGDRSHLTDAASILKQLHEEMPASAMLSTQRGDVARLQGDVEAAMQHYQAAIDQGHPSRNCVLNMASLLFQRGQFADVSMLIRRFEESEREGLDPELARLGAFASLQEESPLEAVRFAKLGVDPQSASYQDLIRLGQFQQIAGQQEQAESSLRRATELVPHQPDGWIALITFLTAAERTQEAETALEQAEAAVTKELVDFTLAQCYEVIGDQERAAIHYGRLTDNFADDPRQLRVTIAFLVRSGERETAKQLLRRMIDEEVSAAVAAGHTPATLLARRLLAAILAETNDYADLLEALDLLNRNLAVVDQAEQRPDLLLKARVLAVSHLQRDQRAGRELFVTLAADAPLPIRDAQQLAELHRDLGETEAAMDAATGLVTRTHRNANVLAWAIDFALEVGQSERHLDPIERWLEILEALPSDQFELRILRARWMIRRGRHEEALAVLQSAETTPEQESSGEEAWRVNLRLAVVTDQIAQKLDRNGQLVEAEKYAHFAEKLYQQVPADSEASLLYVQFLMRRWRVDEALQKCDTLRDILPAEQIAQTYLNLLRSRHLNSAQTADIRSWLESQCEADPDSVVLALSSAHAAALAGDYQAAKEWHHRVLELDEKNIESLNELALLSALQRETSPEALQQIELAIEKAGPVGMLLDTRATVELANQQYADAERSALAAIAETPSADFYFHLAQAQFALGKTTAAREALRAAFKRGLHANSVHPLERSALEKLQIDLER